MFHDLSKHPSNIAKSAVEYLKSIAVSPETRKIYANVLYLFVEHLRSNTSALIKTKSGNYLLSSNWEAYDKGTISNFIDWWLPRTVMDDTVETKAPGVLRKWIRWCYDHQYIDESHLNEFLKALPMDKSKEILRLQKAGELLYRLHTPRAASWKTDDCGKVVSINWKRNPDERYEGYMKIVRIEKDFGFLETRKGIQIGPVMIGKELAKILKIGDVLTVEIGRYGKFWRVLESGNVYGKGTVF
jgi:hypothetical protein